MKEKLTSKRISRIALIAAVYVAVTLATSSLAYMGVQFRIAEMLVLLCFYNKDYCISMVLGCLVANIFSPMALLDIPFGTLATLIAVVLIYYSRNLVISSLYPVIINAVIVGIELKIAFKAPLLLSMGQVALGEFVVVTVVGVPLMIFIAKNRYFMVLIGITNKKLKLHAE